MVDGSCPLVYRTWAVNVAYVVLLWVGFTFTLLSCVFSDPFFRHKINFCLFIRSILMLKAIIHENTIKAIRMRAERLVPDSVILVEFPTGDKEFEDEIDKIAKVVGDV